MLKLAGVCLVVCGCSGLGWHAVSRFATRLRLLQEAEQALHFLYGEMEYSGCDMIELLGRLAMRGGYFGGFWSGLSARLQRYDGRRFSEHWRGELQKVPEIRCLCEEDMEILFAIGENLGNTDRYTQLHTLEIFIERLHNGIGQARKEYRERAKVSIVTGVTAGAFLALLLV